MSGQSADYPPSPDSTRRPGVPVGEVQQFSLVGEGFAGAGREITLYVPAQYRPEDPAALIVAFDGLNYELPTVLDNLIHAGELPAIVAVAIGPGSLPSAHGAPPRPQRSREFDGLGPEMADFVLGEAIPACESRSTADGRPIRVTRDPERRMSMGGSSGAIAAFTLAWERPDAFRKVFSSCGTYLGMRGGETYSTLVRKTEPKPLRIYLQDGENDGLPGVLDEMGDWWVGNQLMHRALRFAGYDVHAEFGHGGHDGLHATAILPEALRWLWRDAEAAAVRASGNHLLSELTVPGEGWREELPEDAVVFSGSSAVSPDGAWQVTADEDAPTCTSRRILPDGGLDGALTLYRLQEAPGHPPVRAESLAFDARGNLFAATTIGIQILDEEGRSRVILPLPSGRPVTAMRLDGRFLVASDGSRQFRRVLAPPPTP
jgi:enterochelin esterase-like enzyme